MRIREDGLKFTAAGRSRHRRPNRRLLARHRRAGRRAEAYISTYVFPAHLAGRVIRRLPELDDAAWPQVERGLREWFVCCAWRGTRVIGMPSRIVAEAWHEFILDTASYTRFCEAAFGTYLHHTPDEAMTTPMLEALAETVRAWDRSAGGAGGEAVLWNLDQRLGLAMPLGITGVQLSAARSRAPYPLATGWVEAGSADARGGGHSDCGGGSS